MRSLLATGAVLASLALSGCFIGNFDTGDLSQWRDFHDAHLTDQSPPGFEVINDANGFSGPYARNTVTNAPGSSATGDASVLWEGNGSNSYSLKHLQNRSDSWFRMQVLFPDGTDSRWAGRFRVWPTGSGGWDIFQEWHSAPGAGYSTAVGVHNNLAGGVLVFRPVGGLDPDNQVFTHLYQRNGGSTDIPLRFNHWYDIVVHLRFGTTAQTGLAEWWVDGVLQHRRAVPTITRRADGTVPGVGHEVGLYRGPSQPYTDTIYLDGGYSGPHRPA